MISGIALFAIVCALALIFLAVWSFSQPTVDLGPDLVKVDDLTERFGGVIERHEHCELRLKCVDGVEAWRLVDKRGEVLLVTYGHRPAGSEISFAICEAESGHEQAVRDFG